MRKLLLTGLLAAALLGASWRDGRTAAAPTPGPGEFKPAREIMVPYEDLPILLEEKTRRVLLTRAEYEQLVAKARRVADARAPVSVAQLSADYSVRVADERAVITGTIVIDVLEDGLYSLGLDFGGVGFRSATLDGKAAPVGLADDGRPVLFIEGKGRHTLEVDLVAPLQTTAARQVLDVQLPTPASAKLQLSVPGDVEVKSGTPVISRVFDEKVPETRFELLPSTGRQTVVMTLNSRLKRHDRVVVSRAVQIDQVTEAFDRLSARFDLSVLHRAVDSFRFTVPDGFDVTDVQCVQLAHWAVAAEGTRRILEVQLREESTGIVTMSFAAVRTRPDLSAWTMPRFEPLDVVGNSCVIGVLLEDRLRMESVAAKDLVPVDASFLKRVLPATFAPPAQGETPIRPVLAYFSPQGSFDLRARFPKPPAKVRVTTSLLVGIDEGAVTLKRGGFSLISEEEKLFSADIRVPAGWQVNSVTSADGSALKFERYDEAGGAARLHVTLPKGVEPRQETRVFIEARREPKGWLDAWSSRSVEVPAFSIAGATKDVGAVAVETGDDLAVRPEKLTGLLPIDQNELAGFGFGGTSPALAWRYESQPWSGTVVVERVLPRVTAETYSFFVIRRDSIAAHYEICYTIAQARTRTLSFMLPASTPAEVAVKGLDGLAVKEFTSAPVAGGTMRKWNVTLAERRDGVAKISVDFQQKVSDKELAGFTAPVVHATDVAYEWGRISIEGSDELDVTIEKTDLRPLDVGALVDAKYQPGNRLLGVYAFVGEAKPVGLSAKHDPAYDLPPAIVQRAEFTTVISADGRSETAALFTLRTKALMVGVNLPKGSTLWSAMLDGEALKPQLQDGTLVVSLSAAAQGKSRALSVLYETPVGGVALWSRVGIPSAKLELRTKSGQTAAIPVVETSWRLYVPPSFRVVRTDGTMMTREVAPPQLAVVNVLEHAYAMTGGVNPGENPAFTGSRRYVTRAMDNATKRVPMDESLAVASHRGYPSHGDQAELLDDLFDDSPVDSNIDARPSVDADAMRPSAGAPEWIASGGHVSGLDGKAPATLGPRTEKGTQAYDGSKAKSSRLGGTSVLSGFRSLPIELQPAGEGISLRSLGETATLDVTVANETRLDILYEALALIVLVVGVALRKQPVGRKAAYVFGVAIIATMVPMLAFEVELALIFNGAFYAAAIVGAYYLAAGIVCWVSRRFSSKIASAVAALVLAVIIVGFGSYAFGDESSGPYVVQVAGPERPVKVPDDAIVVPYDADSRTGIQEAGKLLVPYDKFVELWNLAYPEKRVETKPPPAAFALSGASFRAKLEGDDFLLVQGRVDVTVYAEEFVAVPLALDGGVLAKADLDGRPARLGLPEILPPMRNAMAQQAAPAMPRGRFIVLYVGGKGKHTLDLAVRMKLDRQGGWRIAGGRLPASPATALTLDVPAAQTEVVLAGVTDRSRYETSSADQKIETALDPGAVFTVRWRPRVLEGQIDTSLTADSTGVFDVREDQLKLSWTVTMSFRKGERDSFTLELPAGYVVEKVAGANVRGWEAKETKLNVILLNKARESETFEVTMWKPGAVAAEGAKEFDVPEVSVPGATRQSGSLILRRSPLLDVRTGATAGVSRIDFPAGREAGSGADESPLGLRPYQAWRFNDVPFTLKVSAEPVVAKTGATVETLVRLFERERRLETRATFHVSDRSAYELRVAVPDDFKLERVEMPCVFEWALTTEKTRRIVTVYLADGRMGDVAVVLKGSLGDVQGAAAATVSVFEPLGVESFTGQVAVVVDPAYDVRVDGLAGLESIVVSKVFGWVAAVDQPDTRLALQYSTAGAAGKLILSERKADVACTTMTNVRVTERSVEESILLDFMITKARIREVSFLLPARMKNAVVHAPLMRQKSVTPVNVAGEEMLRVKVELQDGKMGRLMVMVDDDRVLKADEQAASIPVVETAQTIARYVVLEVAGLDEVVPRPEGLEPIGRQQKVWDSFRDLLKSSSAQAWVVKGSEAKPALYFRPKSRELVKTADARIGLSTARITVDAGGAYAAVQSWRMSNAKEQFLSVRMPEGASIWTAWVAGEPVKPVVDASGEKGLVRLPLVKTAEGDLDYEVVVKYGGKMSELSTLAAVKMPLIRTVNIRCEQSTVDLYLPASFRWVRFAGTMSQARQSSRAAEATYWNSVATQVIDASKSTNPYARARAEANRGEVQKKLAEIQDEARSVRRDAAMEIQAEMAKSNDAVLSRGQQDVTMQAGNASPNRTRMEDVYNEQFTNAGNYYQRGDNFKVPQSTTAADVNGNGGMNSQWMAKGEKEADRESFSSYGWAPRLSSQNAANQPAAPDVGQKSGGKIDMRKQTEYGAYRAPQQQIAEDAQGVTQRYQLRLQSEKKREGQAQQVMPVYDVKDMNTDVPNFEQRALEPRGGIFAGGEGLASLDVHIPLAGRRFDFTMTSGDVEITGYPVSVGAISSGKKLLAVLAAVALVFVIRFAWHKGRTLSRQTQSILALACVVVGPIMMVVWVLPLIGFVALAGGIAWFVALRRAKARTA